MARRKKYIDGIYNYCDRWCERCPLTLRCRVYAMEQQSLEGAESSDVSNAAFWSSIQKVFVQTKELLHKIARDRGIDLTAVDLTADDLRVGERRRRTRGNPLVKQGEAYAVSVTQWLEAHEDAFQAKSEQLEQQFTMGLSDCDPEAESVAIGDAMDVIRWYQFQIPVKLSRGVGSREIEASEADEDDTAPDDTAPCDAFPSDADGSVKVALLGIDRSLAAWTLLARMLPDEGDSILDLLVSLDRLRRAAEREFPRARAFVRPGFDTPV